MRFLLSIELGNDAMRTRKDIVRALRSVATSMVGGVPEDGDSGAIRDENGNRVGGWHVEEAE